MTQHLQRYVSDSQQYQYQALKLNDGGFLALKTLLELLSVYKLFYIYFPDKHTTEFSAVLEIVNNSDPQKVFKRNNLRNFFLLFKISVLCVLYKEKVKKTPWYMGTWVHGYMGT